MPKAISVDKQGRLKSRAAMSDTNLLLTITIAVFFILYLFLSHTQHMHTHNTHMCAQHKHYSGNILSNLGLYRR